MIKRVLIIVGLLMLFSLTALWFITGGTKNVSRIANSLGSPIDLITGGESGYSIRLPWQPEELTIGADLSQYESADGRSVPTTPEEIQRQADDLQREINQAKTFGTPSPFKSMVTLSGRESPVDGSALEEYIFVHASGANTAPVSLSGWSLQSVLTGKRVPLPAASNLFVLGVVNPVTSVSLNPGQTAVVISGASPVGVSFRENMCSGYLAQFQTFVPDIERACPDPKNAMPKIPENLQRYGAACFEFVDNLTSCTFPGHTPSSLSSACKAFVTNTYTYNGCVNMYQYRTDFRKDVWRLFLNSTAPLWSNSHDIIRLLDAGGRTVDVLTY